MSDSQPDPPQPARRTLHFQILVAGSLIFLVALCWMTSLPHTNTREQLLTATLPRIVLGIQITGVYLVFVSVIFGQKFLCRRDGASKPKQAAL